MKKIIETYKMTTRYGRTYKPHIETLPILEGDDAWFGELSDMIKMAFVDPDTTSISIRRIKHNT